MNKNTSVLIDYHFENLKNNSKRIFLVRHGHTEYIDVCKTLDPSLSKIGEAQALYLKDFFSDINIDKIYTSKLKRSIDTAKILCGDRNIKTCQLEMLNEIHTIHDWKERNIATSIEIVNYRTFDPCDSLDYGESILNFTARIAHVLENTILNSQYKNIILLVHAEVINTILSIILKLNPLCKITSTFAFGHASITELRYIDPFKEESIPENFCVIQYINYLEHIKIKELRTY